MATKFTKNTATPSIAFIEANKDQNIQAVCEAVAGLQANEGVATWGSDQNSLTVTDTRVISTSRVLVCGVEKGTQDPTGVSYWVDSKSSGSFVLKSQNAEVAGTKINYMVSNQ